MDTFIQKWNKWDIHKRRKFLSNIALSLFVIGVTVPIISLMLAAVFESYKITGLGYAAGVSIELIMFNILIWKEWITAL